MNRDKVGDIKYVEDVRERLPRTRERELLGMFNFLIVAGLFNEQSEPWKMLAQKYISAIWDLSDPPLNLVTSECMR
jgi:hypothetical protein